MSQIRKIYLQDFGPQKNVSAFGFAINPIAAANLTATAQLASLEGEAK